jgi:hypothetical protein
MSTRRTLAAHIEDALLQHCTKRLADFAAEGHDLDEQEQLRELLAQWVETQPVRLVGMGVRTRPRTDARSGRVLVDVALPSGASVPLCDISLHALCLSDGTPVDERTETAVLLAQVGLRDPATVPLRVPDDVSGLTDPPAAPTR